MTRSSQLNTLSHYSLQGNVYIAETDSHRIRKVTVSTGIITTLAGDGWAIYSGDGGQATSAQLIFPYLVALDASGNNFIAKIYTTRPQRNSIHPYSILGNVYIPDSHSCVIRKVTVSTGIITKIAGTGSNTYSGDGGAATSAALKYPYGVALDASGTTYLLLCNYFRSQRN